MALTALSMDNRGGVQNLDALQHYQKALPSLQNSLRASEDLSSDVALLTHFILLLYEVRISSSEDEPFRFLKQSQLDRCLRAQRIKLVVCASGAAPSDHQTQT